VQFLALKLQLAGGIVDKADPTRPHGDLCARSECAGTGHVTVTIIAGKPLGRHGTAFKARILEREAIASRG